MKIISLASGVTSLVNKEIETSVQRLFVDLKLAKTDADYVETAAYAKSLIADMCGTTKVTILAQRADLTETLVREIELAKLLEASTPNECVMRLDYDGLNARLRGNIDVAIDGAAKLNQNTKLLISINGKVSTATLDIYTMDLPVETNLAQKMEEIHMNANVEKAITTEGLSTLVLPADKIVSLKAYYRNGRQISIDPEELKQRMFDTEDPILCFNGIVYFGHFSYICFSVSECWKVELSINATEPIHSQRIIKL